MLDQSIQAKHLLRAILRECTYLPDPRAKLYYTRYILHRTRTLCNKFFKLKQNHRHPNDAFLQAKVALYMKKAHVELTRLRRANLGVTKPLQRILYMTYARTGPRRRIIMQHLIRSNGFFNTLPSLINSPHVNVNTNLESVPPSPSTVNNIDTLGIPLPLHGTRRITKGKIVYHISDEFSALKVLTRSQIQRQKLWCNPVRTLVKSDQLAISAKNIWLNDMPFCRERRSAQRWFASLLDRLMVPLPLDEWNHLRRLAMNEFTWHGAPRRRSSGLPCPLSLIPQRDRFLAYLGDPRLWQHAISAYRSSQYNPLVKLDSHTQLNVNAESAERAINNQLERMLNRIHATPTQHLNSSPHGKNHTISRRYMQRLWAKVFTFTPTMSWDHNTANWKIKWGS